MAVDCSAIQADLIPSLHADSLGNLTAATQADLYRSFNAGLRELAKRGVFAAADDALTVAGGVATKALPARHIQTLYAASRMGGNPWAPMDRVTRAQLEALDAGWAAATDDEAPRRYVEELEGGETLRVHPAPATDAGLTLVYLERPADVSTGSPSVTAPAPVEDYLYYRALADARAKNQDEAMPDVAAFCQARLTLLEDAFAHLWG